MENVKPMVSFSYEFIFQIINTVIVLVFFILIIYIIVLFIKNVSNHIPYIGKRDETVKKDK